MAKSGQRSRTSSRKGRRRKTETTHAETAWKIGGVVPMTRSTRPAPRAVFTEVTMKLRNDTTRHRKLRWMAFSVFARSTRTPSTRSSLEDDSLACPVR